MKLFFTVALFAAVASAQDAMPNPLITVSKSIYAMSKGNVLGSVEAIPEDLWSFQPTKDVRTVAQLFAHIADGQYEFCGPVGGDAPTKDIEKTAKTKAEIVAALKEAFAYCDATYARMTDADAATIVPIFNLKVTKLGAMDYNIAHNMEHYGNLVTYMRIKGIVPPSSAPRGPSTTAKKQ